MELRLFEYVFRILYKSSNPDTAVNAILEVIGRQFDVSRVYIFENEEDPDYCKNTYEWCNDCLLYTSSGCAELKSGELLISLRCFARLMGTLEIRAGFCIFR